MLTNGRNIMAENNENNLDMSLFQDQDLELNLELAPVDLTSIPSEEEEEEVNPFLKQETITPEATEESVEEGDETEKEKLGEDESSEVVAEEEGPDEGESQDNSPIYSSFATVLSEQGLLPSVDLQNTDIKSVDDLTAVLKTEIENQGKQYVIDKIGEDGYEALEKGISLSELQQFNNTTTALESITTETLSNDGELAKRIILQDYINQGIDENRALRILNKSIDAGEDAVIEDAIESLESLKTFEQGRIAKVAEERQEQQAALVAQQEKIDNDLKNSIYKNDEFLEGYKVNKSMQDKVYNSITKIVSTSPEGIAENKLMQQRRQDPISFDTKLYYLYELTKGFEDFSKLVTKSTSKATTQLEKALRQNKFEQGGDPTFLDNESYGGIGSELVFD